MTGWRLSGRGGAIVPGTPVAFLPKSLCRSRLLSLAIAAPVQHCLLDDPRFLGKNRDDMLAPRRNRSGRVSETIARRIKKQISDGALIPGEKLPAEREMAQRFRTSRVSVREAYRSLEELGLLTIRRGAEGGAFIADIDHGPMMRSLSLMLRLGKTTNEEITEARLLIEPPVARLAARRAHTEDVDRLIEVVHQQETALRRRGDYGPFDLQFHRSVATCARNLPLQVLVDALSDLTVEVVAGLDLSAGVQHQVCDSHRQIAYAIKRRDEEAAYKLMLQHVAQIQSRLGRALARQRKAKKLAERNGARVGRGRG
jgi:GntR family transcriptional repressor for pyruvate dehydrogenase complex